LDSRIGLASALARLEAGEAGALVVSRLDRLARDYALQELTITKLAANGTPILSVNDTDVDTDTDDPTRILIRQIVGSIGQYERALIRGRMMAGKAVKVARGGYGGGRPRYGSKAKDGELVEDPSEQRLVQRVRELRAEGQSYRQVCVTLEAEGYRPRRAEHWSPATVRKISIRS
jgi:DNA invertase Pin-like site-specific DNA recombinase